MERLPEYEVAQGASRDERSLTAALPTSALRSLRLIRLQPRNRPRGTFSFFLNFALHLPLTSRCAACQTVIIIAVALSFSFM